MITSEIQQYVQSQIQKAQQNSLYSTKNVASHTHNGIDSPIIKAGIQSVEATTPLSGSGTVDSPLVFTNPGYISGNQTITLSGPVTGSGTTAITTSITDVSISGGIVTMTSKFQLPVGTNLY